MRDDDQDPELAPTVPSPDSDRAAVMAAETRTVAGGTKSPEPEALPTSIDRYQIVGRIGEGGMGVVYEATDPDLKRRVAVKVVRGRAGLVREAQAMAQLSHPSVVPVFDVGGLPEGDGVFIAMELVEGETLRDWLKGAKRPWKQVVQKLVAAGRGLAAAHAAGIVHRDFKPANVLVGMDGRVRVTDFGLARVDESIDGAPVKDGETGIAGTPGYVAPEALDGVIDAKVDQFAFCVSFYEALYGERPFDAGSGSGRSPLIAMAEEAKRTGVKPAPRGRDVPGWLRAMIVRGLDVDPAKRWPTVTALLDAIERVPRRNRVLVGAATAATALAGVVAISITASSINNAAQPACDGFAARLNGVWDDHVRERVRAALVQDGGARGDETWTRVSSSLDGYATSWVASATDVCTASEIRREISSDERDLRMRCLGHRLRAFDALVGALAAAPVGLLDTAVVAANGLPELQVCDVPELLSPFAVPPDAVRDPEAIEAVQRDIADAMAAFTLRQHDDGMSKAAAAAEAARELRYPSLEAEALSVQAEHADALDRPDMLELLVAAGLAAEAAGMDGLRLRGLVSIAGLHIQGRRFEEAEATINTARAVLTRIPGGPHAAREASLLALMAELSVFRDREPDARQQLEAALEWVLRAQPPEKLMEAQFRMSLANVLSSLGEHDRATSEAATARALVVEELGASHANVGMLLQLESVIATRRGDLVAAEALTRQAIEHLTGVFGPEHRRVHSSMQTLLMILQSQERYEDALVVATDGERRSRAADGSETPLHARWLYLLASLESDMGRRADAITHLEAALPTLRTNGTPTDLAAAMFTLGRNLWDEQRDRRHARALLVEAIAILVQVDGIQPQVIEWLRVAGLPELIPASKGPP